jgi:hypothetical protein
MPKQILIGAIVPFAHLHRRDAINIQPNSREAATRPDTGYVQHFSAPPRLRPLILWGLKNNEPGMNQSSRSHRGNQFEYEFKQPL